MRVYMIPAVLPRIHDEMRTAGQNASAFSNPTDPRLSEYFRFYPTLTFTKTRTPSVNPLLSLGSLPSTQPSGVRANNTPGVHATENISHINDIHDNHHHNDSSQATLQRRAVEARGTSAADGPPRRKVCFAGGLVVFGVRWAVQCSAGVSAPRDESGHVWDNR